MLAGCEDSERGRFELPRPLTVCSLSKRVHSTTLPPLQALLDSGRVQLRDERLRARIHPPPFQRGDEIVPGVQVLDVLLNSRGTGFVARQLALEGIDPGVRLFVRLRSRP